jgi:aromatic-L-amino-acid decarboxylase
MTPDEFRVFGHALVDWIAEYRSTLPKLRVMSDRKPGEIRALLPTQPPSEPEPMESLLADLRRVVLPGMTHWSHPSPISLPIPVCPRSWRTWWPPVWGRRR